MRGLVLCGLSCLAGPVAGDYTDGLSGILVSPVLEKCLDLKMLDGETAHQLEKQHTANAQLYTCHGDANQRFTMYANGQIKSDFVPYFCLEAEHVNLDGANVHFAECDDKPEQMWTFVEGTRGGTLRVGTSDTQTRCLDVKAERSADGGREVWSEIKMHEAVNVQLYECHDEDPTYRVDTGRVNQLFKWNLAFNRIQRNSLHDLGFKAIAPASLALTMLAISLLAAGVAIGTYRARRVNALPAPLGPTE